MNSLSLSLSTFSRSAEPKVVFVIQAKRFGCALEPPSTACDLGLSSDFRMALRCAGCCCLKSCVLLCLLFFTCRASSDVDGLKEKTLAMIKPDGVDGKYVDAIKEIIINSGFSITEEIERQLDEDTVKSFYAEHASKSFFPNLVQYMTSGPVRILVIEKENAVADWRALIGPTDAKKAKVTHPESVRALCGLNSERNCVHGSDLPQSAAREISFFFQKSSPDSISKHDEL